MTIKAANFAKSTLQIAVQPTDTVLVLAAVDVDKFPTLSTGDWFYLTLDNGVSQEIVKCINITGSSFTVQRGQDGTTARAWPAGTPVYCAITAGTVSDILANATGVSEVPGSPSGAAYVRALGSWVNADSRYARLTQGNTFTGSPQTIEASTPQIVLSDAGQSRAGRLKVTGNASETHLLFDGIPAQSTDVVRVRFGRETPARRLSVEMFYGDGSSTLAHRFTYDEAALVIPGGRVGIGIDTPRTALDVVATDALILPSGTTDQRPSSVPAGALRFNTTTNTLEFYTGSSWAAVQTSTSGAPVNTLLLAETSGDLPGSGYTFPGLYRLQSDGSAVFYSKLNKGLYYKLLPTPGGSGSPAPFTFLGETGNGDVVYSLSIPSLNISAGKVVILLFTDHGSSPPSASSISHAALSNQVTRGDITAYSLESRVGRVTAYEFNSTGGTDTLTVNFTNAAWVAKIQVWQVASANIGPFLGIEAGPGVTSGNTVSASRTDPNAAVDLVFAWGAVSTAGPSWSASRNNDTLQAAVYSSWINGGATTAAGSVSGQTQTFTITPGNFVGAKAAVMQWGAPSGGAASYTIGEDDIGLKLLAQPGTTNLTLPVLGLPYDSGSNTGIEGMVVVEVPPSSTLNLLRGSGAEFWTGPSSGNVASAVVTCNASQRKILVLGHRHPGLWQVLSGAVD